MRKGLIILGLLCYLISFAFSKEVIVQSWQKENIQLPVISTTYKTTVNSAQLRLLTKYYAIEKAYSELQTVILSLPVDSSRSIQTVVDKRPQLAAGLDTLIRDKSILTGFEYSSDSSATINIALDAKLITKLFQPYWKPERPPKPAKSKEEKEAVKAQPKKVKKEKAKEEKKTKKIDESQKSITPSTKPTPNPDVKKEEQPPKDSATP
jgi:hypothetical protein